MICRTLDSLAEFEAIATPLLLAREDVNSLSMRILKRLTAHPPAVPPGDQDGPLLVVVGDDANTPVAVALQTPPRPLVLTDPSPAIALAIESHLAASECVLPGVIGPAAAAAAMAHAHAGRTHRTDTLVRSMRVYRLDRAVPPAKTPPGECVAAAHADHPAVESMARAFGDAIREPVDAARLSSELLPAGQIYLWKVDGEPVSIAAWHAASPNGGHVSLVYTPPRMRRRGYATSLVAAVSQRVLESGRRFVCLYADNADPTASAIYQRIGYIPIADAEHHEFV